MKNGIGKSGSLGSMCGFSSVARVGFFFVKAVDLRTKVHPLYSLILLTGILMHRYFFLFFFKSQKVAMLSSGLSE